MVALGASHDKGMVLHRQSSKATLVVGAEMHDDIPVLLAVSEWYQQASLLQVVSFLI